MHVSCGREDDCDDEAEESDGLCENEDKDHAHEKFWLDSVHADSDVAHDTDGKARGLKG